MTDQFGFIGLGNLGIHLAASLVRAGFPLTVHDLNKNAAAPLLAAGATWADSPQQVAATATSVFTCLPSSKAVSAVVSGEQGILSGIQAGCTWIDMSTNERNETLRLAALAAARGIATLEAPVTDGVHKAAAGEITVLVGGEAAIYQAHLPALQAMGQSVLYIGPLGSAAVSDDGKQFLLNPKGRHFSRVRASELLLLDADNPHAMTAANAPICTNSYPKPAVFSTPTCPMPPRSAVYKGMNSR